MEPKELERRVAEFPRWHYKFEFDNGVSTLTDSGATPRIYRKNHIRRHEHRRHYFFDALLQVTGGSLSALRVLDLGCNAGYWSLAAIEAGADFVLGIDGRQMHVDQAGLVFEAKEIDPNRYRFEEGDIFRHDIDGTFDVVLCLGVMYHISKPVELFELIARVGADIVVIDTEVYATERSAFRVDRVVVENPMSAVDYPLALVPSRQAVVDLASLFGFQTVALAPNMTDYEGAEHYLARTRLALIGSKSASLDALQQDTRRPVTPLVTKLARRLTHSLRARTPAGREQERHRQHERERRTGLERRVG